jgi:hypothetical protein
VGARGQADVSKLYSISVGAHFFLKNSKYSIHNKDSISVGGALIVEINENKKEILN